ncbi:MAG: shikimate dehydrogenase [Chloroflexi bacterium]|nr:shikimate dehydrogenase [Chloroflexota bacterium]|tara:strand:+ start:44085 stop:44816 length:732 start_codon:yes stop_codon:yes gene_type:complete
MKCYVIAEIASNWEGSIAKAKKLIQASKNSGADAVKFQMWRASDLYASSHPNWKEIKKSELTYKKIEKLKQTADEIGIEFFCSAFYPEAIEFLEKLSVKRYKIASRTCLMKDPFSKETLQKKATTGKPVIISMGMGGNKKQIKKIFEKNNVTFCYCISKYPTPISEINWKNAITYDGFSDHTLGITAPLIFCILKKQNGNKNIIIEKHVKLKNSKGPDASSSIDTDELKLLVSNIRLIEKMKL